MVRRYAPPDPPHPARFCDIFRCLSVLVRLTPGGLLVILAGLFFATQSGVNARLARTPGSNPPFSALQSFLIGTLCCFVFLLIWSRGFGGVDIPMAFRSGPWWQWMGGFLGAGVVVVNVLEVPRLGAGSVSAVLVGSLVVSVGTRRCGGCGLMVELCD